MTLTILHPRAYGDFAAFAAVLDQLRQAGALRFTHLIAPGPRTLVARYAGERGLPLTVIEPAFARHRGRALAEHQARLLEATVQLVAFDDGADQRLSELIDQALARHLPAVVVVPVHYPAPVTGTPKLYGPHAASRTALW